MHACDRAGSGPDHVFEFLPVTGLLRERVTALIGIETRAVGPLALSVAPHESMVLAVQMARGAEPFDVKHEGGLHAALTGIREATATYHGAGDCLSLFALLTPLGAVELLDSRRLADARRIQAPLAGLLDLTLVRALESDLVRSRSLGGRLERLARWLETRAARPRSQAPAALRVARAATAICRGDRTDVETLAREQVVSRRQLERDFQRWLGTSPRHLGQVARLQQVSRRAHRGCSLATVAADAGFADQAHMSRVVRSLTGLTPTGFIGSRVTPVAEAFRLATGGSTIYL